MCIFVLIPICQRYKIIGALHGDNRIMHSIMMKYSSKFNPEKVIFYKEFSSIFSIENGWESNILFQKQDIYVVIKSLDFNEKITPF